jgi:hypothetical protein
MHSSSLELTVVTEVQTTEAHSSLDLTKATYSINRLSMVEKGNVIVQINPSNFPACKKKEKLTR